jgi:hypothetical protein
MAVTQLSGLLQTFQGDIDETIWRWGKVDKGDMPWLAGKTGWLKTEGIPQLQPADIDPILVIGIPRSGTSMAAGILHHLGVRMGRVYTSPDANNPRGYFEARWFGELVDALHHNLCDIETFRHVISYQVSVFQSFGIRWGLKHSFIPFCLEYWLSLCPQARIISCERPIEELAPRIKQVWGYNKIISDRFIAAYLAELAYQKEKIDHENWLTVSFHEVRADPAATVQKLIDFCRIPAHPDDASRAIDFIDPSQITYRGEVYAGNATQQGESSTEESGPISPASGPV